MRSKLTAAIGKKPKNSKNSLCLIDLLFTERFAKKVTIIPSRLFSLIR